MAETPTLCYEIVVDLVEAKAYALGKRVRKAVPDDLMRLFRYLAASNIKKHQKGKKRLSVRLAVAPGPRKPKGDPRVWYTCTRRGTMRNGWTVTNSEDDVLMWKDELIGLSIELCDEGLDAIGLGLNDKPNLEFWVKVEEVQCEK